MRNTRKLWLALATLVVVSFGVLVWAGTEIFRAAPPMPEKVVS
jgi:nitric oxide reductase subunit B